MFQFHVARQLRPLEDGSAKSVIVVSALHPSKIRNIAVNDIIFYIILILVSIIIWLDLCSLAFRNACILIVIMYLSYGDDRSGEIGRAHV